MIIGWNFPPTNGGQRQGINETGIAIFKGDPIKSLAREICQNSLDAGLENKVVRIEFEIFSTKVESFPDVVNFSRIIDRCLMTSNEEKNVKAINFFKKAQEVLRDQELIFLRISDFNTKGLTNSDSQIKSDWLDLVKKSGSSNKGDTMGGSFGIGKSAPFVCSDLQTVFYSTLDVDGKIASQGVSRLISHKLDNVASDFTQGVGYYGQIDGLLHVNSLISIQPGYKRTQSGTDIFIAGFSDYDNWDVELIKEILDGYLYAIYSGSLEIKINDLLLNRDTIDQIINNNRTAMPQKTLAYYDVLTSPKTHWIEKDFMKSGNVKLGLLIDQNGTLPRKVAMIRNPWMKIKDQEDISSISFMGMMIIESQNLNEFLRKIENPSHTNWEPNRASSKSEIEVSKRLLKGFKKFIQDEINQLITRDGIQELDLEGANEYLPYDDSDDESKNKEIDVLSPKVVNIEIKKINKLRSQQNSKQSFNRQEFYELVKGGLLDGDGETYVDDHVGSNSEIEKPSGLGDKPKDIIDGDKNIPSPKSIQPLDIRLFCIDKKNGIYRLNFTSSKNAIDCSAVINSLDEQGNRIPVELVDARLNDELLSVKLNRIFKFEVKQGESINIDFKTKVNNYFTAEVVINGIEA